MHPGTFQTLPFIGLAAVLAAAESGCTREAQPPKATYTVDEYLAKPDVMAAKLRECTNNPGELRDNPDCINVKEAVKRQGIGSWNKMAPLKFQQPGSASNQPEPAHQ